MNGEERTKLVMAYAIAETQSIITALCQLADGGEKEARYVALNLQVDQGNLAREWANFTEMGLDPYTSDLTDIVLAAQVYVTEHIPELEQILGEEGR